jgi:hypothetical protein
MFPAVNELTACVVIVKFAALAFAGIVTDVGTCAVARLLAKFTTTLADVALVNVTVPDRDCPPMADAGVTVSEASAAAAGTGL